VPNPDQEALQEKPAIMLVCLPPGDDDQEFYFGKEVIAWTRMEFPLID
jgi:hypothetical protein